MSESRDQELDRRQFITGGAAAASIVASLGAAEAHASSTIDKWAATGPAVLLHDSSMPMPEEVQRRLDANGTKIIVLSGDPVWLWRSEAGTPLRDPSTTLLGVTGWAELLVFRGLAAETRRHLRYEKLAADGKFIWLVA